MVAYNALRGAVQVSDDRIFCQVDQTKQAKLVFVRLVDELLHVTAFRERAKQERLHAECPACHSPVTVRLGEHRVAHAAHRKGTGHACPATSGESALHLNTKIALGQSLQALADSARLAGRLPELEVALACLGEQECPLPAWRPWAVAWDHVEIECRIGIHRPDIVLSLGGREVGAIEVLVTSEVTPEKASALRILNVPWLEVRAVELGFHGTRIDGPWTPGTALPVYRASKDSGQWYCPKHEAARRLSDARRRYQTMKENRDPAVSTLVAYGKALAESEKEVAELIAEIEAVQRATDAEVARLHSLADELPKKISESQRLLERAKQDFADTEARSAQRITEARDQCAKSVFLEEDLHKIDDELRQFERLRRRLSGYPEEPSTPGRFVQDVRRTLFWRVVDIYTAPTRHSRPKAMRCVLHVDRVAVPGKAHELVLMEDENLQLCRVDASHEDAFVRLCAALDARIAHKMNAGVLIDYPCDWVRLQYGESIPNEAWWERTGSAPQAYSWSGSEERWVLVGVVDTPAPGV
jgi:hypothetical protein